MFSILRFLTSDSDEWIEYVYEKSSDADVEIVGCSNSGRSTFGASTDHVSINSDSGDADTSSRTSSTVSLLNVLKAPKLSSLSRKQTQARNLNPPRDKQRCRGTSAHDPKGIRPIQRVKEYPNEPFSISNNKLFCKGCREELCVKKSSVSNHLKSSKHIKGKEKLRKKEIREKDLTETLQRYNNEVHLRGETLPLTQQVFRVKHFASRYTFK